MLGRHFPRIFFLLWKRVNLLVVHVEGNKWIQMEVCRYSIFARNACYMYTSQNQGFWNLNLQSMKFASHQRHVHECNQYIHLPKSWSTQPVGPRPDAGLSNRLVFILFTVVDPFWSDYPDRWSWWLMTLAMGFMSIGKNNGNMARWPEDPRSIRLYFFDGTCIMPACNDLTHTARSTCADPMCTDAWAFPL